MGTDKMTYTEPLPCCEVEPFGFEIEGDYGLRFYRLHCPVCKKHLTERNRKKAIERWNKKVVTDLWQLNG